MSNVLVVGADPRRARLIDKGLEGASLHVTRRRWATFLHTRRPTTQALVIYDLAGVDAPQTDILARLPAEMPDTGVLYLAGTDRKELEALSQTLQQTNVDFIVEAEDAGELRLRANRLLARGKARGLEDAVKPSSPTRLEALRHTVPQLHAQNGRLDARAVSTLYGVSLAALARALGRSEQTVHKTPTAHTIQPTLRLYERVAAMLLRLTGSEIGLRAWLNASNPELEEEAPLTLLLNGEGEVVADLLEDVLCGAPV